MRYNYLCFKHFKKSLKKTVRAQGGQDCGSLGQTTHIVSYVASGTQSGVQCPRKKIISRRPTRCCLPNCQDLAVSLTFGAYHVGQRERPRGHGPSGVDCHGQEGYHTPAPAGGNPRGGSWRSQGAGGSVWGLLPRKCPTLPLTFDLDLMKGNPTLHLRKSDSSSSQEMPISS